MYMQTADFLLYVQHLSMCESAVNVSSQGPGHLRFEAEGELIAVVIQHAELDESAPVVCTSVVFKYIRAILPVLQRVDTLVVQIVPQQLAIRVDLPGYTLTTTLKSQIRV